MRRGPESRREREHRPGTVAVRAPGLISGAHGGGGETGESGKRRHGHVAMDFSLYDGQAVKVMNRAELSGGSDFKQDEGPVMQPKTRRRYKLSAVVVSYNREEMIGTVLRGLQFADEVILLDKSSTDRTAEIGGAFADRVVRVPWSPTVEETRVSMESLCAHDWVLFLDDDECLSPEAALFIDEELYEPRADLYRLPRREYIMAQHDEDAYYWPESHIRLFRKGALRFVPTVHGGIEELSERRYVIPTDAGIAIHHLSHASLIPSFRNTRAIR